MTTYLGQVHAITDEFEGLMPDTTNLEKPNLGVITQNDNIQVVTKK